MNKLFRLVVVMIVAQILAACAGSQSANGTPNSPDVPIGDAVRGQEIFTAAHGDAPSCASCHHIEEGAVGLSLGPNLAGISTRASERVTDQSAEEYLTDSILNPSAFIVPGFRESMFPEFGDHLSAQQVADLVAYLMTL